MTKVKKIISLVIALVLIASSLCGCAYFYDSASAYMDRVVMKVGDEEVTYSQFYSVYSSLYSTYSSYISAGYYTESDLFTLACSTLANTYLLVDAYKNDSATVTYQHEYVDKFVDAEYLTEDDMIYVIKYVKSTMYSALDATLEEYFTENGYTIADEEEDDTTDRKAPENKVITSLTDEVFALDIESVNESLVDATTDSLDYTKFFDEYVFDSATNEKLIEVLGKLNKRVLESDNTQDPITAREYIAAQKKAVVSVRSTAYSSYGIEDLTKYITKQINETITNILIQKAQITQLKAQIENDVTKLCENLTSYWTRLTTGTLEEYILDDEAYLSFITALSDTSFIEVVDDDYELIFVKNLLIPFDDAQTAVLDTMEDAANGITAIGDETSTELAARKEAALEDFYAYREQLAMNVLAENFLDDGAALASFFEYNETTQKVQLIADSTLKTSLDAVTTGEQFEELMYEYNTDTAQHTSWYDYVVNVNPDDSFTTSWVDEFQEACEELYDGGAGLGKYTICVTSYGIHIIYYDSDVAKETPNFNATTIYDTSTNEYRFFETYYGLIQNAIIQDYYQKADETTEITVTDFFKKLAESGGYTIPDFE